MIKLITWEMDRAKTPTDPAERVKLTMSLCQMVKKGVDSGQTKMWGMNPGGSHGFSVSEGDENEIFAMVAQYIPYVKFKVEPMLSIDEVLANLKALQQQT